MRSARIASAAARAFLAAREGNALTGRPVIAHDTRAFERRLHQACALVGGVFAGLFLMAIAEGVFQ